MRRLTLTATTLLLLPAVPASALAAATPAAVKRSASSIDALHSGTGDGSSVRIGEAGSTLTATALVSRTGEIFVTGADKRSTRADRVVSDAPDALALLKRRGAPSAPGVTPAKARVQKGATVWVLSRSGIKPAAATRIVKTRVASSSSQRLELAAVNQTGRNGGAIVTSDGRLVGITVPPGTGQSLRGRQRGVPVTETPTPQGAAAPAAAAGFPAVPVTIGLGTLLLISQLVLVRRRRVVGAAPRVASTTVGAAEQTRPPSVGSTEPTVDVQVTLRPRG